MQPERRFAIRPYLRLLYLNNRTNQAGRKSNQDYPAKII
jgi:hypothetical protein